LLCPLKNEGGFKLKFRIGFHVLFARMSTDLCAIVYDFMISCQ
jgi:hypothetical protein